MEKYGQLHKIILSAFYVTKIDNLLKYAIIESL